MTLGQFNTAVRPKVHDALNLHNANASADADLDFVFTISQADTRFEELKSCFKKAVYTTFTSSILTRGWPCVRS